MTDYKSYNLIITQIRHINIYYLEGTEIVQWKSWSNDNPINK